MLARAALRCGLPVGSVQRAGTLLQRSSYRNASGWTEKVGGTTNVLIIAGGLTVCGITAYSIRVSYSFICATPPYCLMLEHKEDHCKLQFSDRSQEGEGVLKSWCFSSRR